MSTRQNLEDLLRFLREDGHFLRERPELFFQQAASQPPSTAPAQLAERRFNQGLERRSWLRWLNKRQNRARRLLTTHLADEPTSCAFSPDGARVVTLFMSGWQLSDASSGNVIATHREPSSRCQQLSQEGSFVLGYRAERVAAEVAARPTPTPRNILEVNEEYRRDQADARYRFTILISDVASGTVVAEFEMAQPAHRCVPIVASTDRRRIVGLVDDALELWHTDTGAAISLAPRGSVCPCAFSRDGTHVAARWWNQLRIWDTTTGAEDRTIDVESCMDPGGIAFSPDGTRILSADSWELKIWDVATGTEQITFGQDDQDIGDVVGERSRVHSCGFSPNGSTVAAVFENGRLRVWDATTGEVELAVHAHSASTGGHRAAAVACAFSSDGTRLVSAGRDRKLAVWDVGSLPRDAASRGHADTVMTCALSSDGKRIISGANDGTLKMWDAANGSEVWTIQAHWMIGRQDRRFGRPLTLCAISPDGTRVISGHTYGPLKLWNASTGSPCATLHDDRANIWGCTFSPDGSKVAATFHDRLRIWNASDGKLHATLQPRSQRGFNNIAPVFSPDGSRVVVSDGHQLRVCRVATGREQASLEHDGYISGVAVSPDGARLVAAHNWSGRKASLQIWELSSSRKVIAISQGTSQRAERSCSYLPDSTHIAAIDQYNNLKVWNAETGALAATLALGVEFDADCDYALSPDGKHVAARSKGALLTIWDWVRGARVCEIPVDGPPTSIEWSPEGERIVTGSRTGVYVFQLENVAIGPPAVNAWQRRSTLMPWRSEKTFHYGCPVCRTWSPLNAKQLGHDVACGQCGRRLSITAFVIAGDWKPIASAWRH